ncbi:transcriptional regulator, LacI family [Microlunatus sagamiharensis]|uniref:Transcriptional regulator, LacI family n=1 Tax=Microlunatus sagamiharensis TaxID=546874 RepID=A0A1H2MJ83_9ACTN|nr:LacI family DNA-binding transcriptional regulator [Microlunatus sagamiharensis]SDU93313.1 transcriptional regulator, LacI family [Microlunatus sagamiharensis]
MPQTEEPARRATAAEVARRAGVSPAVVSYVVNGGPRNVAPGTAARVRDAVRDLGYRPNRAARALRRGSTGIVGLVIPRVANPFMAELSEAVQDAAARRGLAVLAAGSGNEPDVERELLQTLPRHGVDGLLVATVLGHADPPPGTAPGLPTVYLNAPFPVGGRCAVGPDATQGARLVVDHLLAVHGHRSVALVTGESGARRAGARELGWQQALAAYDAAPGPVVRVGWDRRGGSAAVAALLAGPQRPTAVFATSDAQALGVLHGLRAAGVRVPEDVAVVGFDGIEEAAYAAPPLTTAKQPVAAMAEAALDALERPGGPVEGHQVLGLDLVVRESCGCPAPPD